MPAENAPAVYANHFLPNDIFDTQRARAHQGNRPCAAPENISSGRGPDGAGRWLERPSKSRLHV